jgi:predicted ferric reductase
MGVGMAVLRWQKITLLAMILLTGLAPLLFVPLEEPTQHLRVFKIIAKFGSLSGAVLIFWQFFLGFRGAIARVIPDLIWVLGVHKKIGTYILVSLIILHPVFITLYYLERHQRTLLSFTIRSTFDIFVLLGILALAVLCVIVVTSIYRTSFKSYSAWYFLHLTSYVLLALVVTHSLFIGTTIKGTPLGFVWWGVLVALACFCLYRLAVRLGWFVKRHRVTEVQRLTPEVVRITMHPLSSKVNPKTGQFVFVQWGFWGSARPFTVSHYDKITGELSVTVKALGKTTTLLQNIQPGDIVAIDGPYGIFTHAALESNRPLVMIAGGIGITPFTRLFDELAYEPGRELHLFYGNKYTDEIVYREEIEDIEHVNVIHVLSHEQDYAGEKGFVTVDLVKRYLARDLKEYEFLICGPPVMMEKLRTSLAAETVPAGQIHFEQFGY